MRCLLLRRIFVLKNSIMKCLRSKKRKSALITATLGRCSPLPLSYSFFFKIKEKCPDNYYSCAGARRSPCHTRGTHRASSASLPSRYLSPSSRTRHQSWCPVGCPISLSCQYVSKETYCVSKETYYVSVSPGARSPCLVSWVLFVEEEIYRVLVRDGGDTLGACS
jgi:hypothetical protein